MAGPLDSAIDAAAACELFRPLEGVWLALAVSGGVDSMALMHLVAAWARTERAIMAWRQAASSPAAGIEAPSSVDAPAPAWLSPEAGTGTCAGLPPGTPPPVVVMTVDHGLRPESATEARWVADQARDLGLPHHILTWSDERPATGVQAAARAARYRLCGEAISAEAKAWHAAGSAWGAAACRDPGRARHLVTAHHRDDAAETLLMRLARGSGLDGLAGMRASMPLTLPPHGTRRTQLLLRLERPLLGVPKGALRATLSAVGGTWLEDPSNERLEFERIRWRKAEPVLADLGLTNRALALSAKRLARALDAVDVLVEERAARSVRRYPGLCARIEASALVSEREAEIAIRLLRRLIDCHGGQEEPVRLAQVEALRDEIGTATANGAARRWTLGGVVVDLQPGLPDLVVHLWREPGRAGLPQVPIEPGDSLLWDRRFVITAQPSAPAGAYVSGLGPEGRRLLLDRVSGIASWPVPRGALETLPGVWMGGQLVAVPYLSPSTAAPSPLTSSLVQEAEKALGPLQSAYRGTPMAE